MLRRLKNREAPSTDQSVDGHIIFYRVSLFSLYYLYIYLLHTPVLDNYFLFSRVFVVAFVLHAGRRSVSW